MAPLDGQRLRLGRKGGPIRIGGKPGDLYVVLRIASHSVCRLSGRDLYLGLPLAPWEAVLGATVGIPTLGGVVALDGKPFTSSGRKLRLGRRGLLAADGAAGDLYAVVLIAVPGKTDAATEQVYRRLAKQSSFNPRTHFEMGSK